MADRALDRFSAPTRAWFEASFAAPTGAQAQGWPAIGAGEHTLLLAPTGSGKTLAAFLSAIDRLGNSAVPPKGKRCRVLYISPLRALAVDIEKNLRAPLAGIALAAERLGAPFTPPTVAMRTGDTPAKERQHIARTPPDILITTPESLYLLLTSQAREILRSIETVIVDEIHALAPTKRGAHLALSLERLDAITDTSPQRIGLSATQRPLDEIARFLGGQTDAGARPVTILDAGSRKELDIEVIVPVDDMTEPGAHSRASGATADSLGLDAPEADTSIWPHVHPRVLELIVAHRTTIVFCNARRTAERLAAHLNDLAGQDLVRAHHGSLSREQRLHVESELKAGHLRAIVATSSLELGIDMGAVDLVVLVESPGSVSRGLQRIGRAGHQVGEPSSGKIFPKYRGDLLETAIVVERMRSGLVEEMRYPRNPLDVLAQQIVAATAVDEWDVDQLLTLVRGAANFADLSDDVFRETLDMLAGRYPSDQFAGLRPRVVWDRTQHRVRARQGAQHVAVASGGTIPDRGLFGVFLPDGARVGELDEEMVYETRVGECFVLGASTWRIEEITFDRVVVVPAPGEPARTPFWRGDKPGRPLELGRAMGALVRELRELPDQADGRLRASGLDPRAVSNLRAYLDEQAETTGAVPDDRTVVIERFADEIGDWRVCVLTPFGARVHAPWALAIEEKLARLDLPVQVLWSDDGIICRLPESLEEIPLDLLLVDPEELDDLVVTRVPATSLFASRFRENAARALLLPRRRPGERTPLWQQRQRAAGLLEVASGYPTFPILLETTRECLRDVFDLPALRDVLADIRSRRVRVVTVETRHASPFAQSLLFGWIAVYMYEGDAPLAERRVAALALDRDLLRDLLGAEELRELLDPAVIAALELELQRLVPERWARHADDLHDLLADLGPLNDDEIRARCVGDPDAWIDALVHERRAIRVGTQLAAVEDAARLRDALGLAIPAGLPTAFTDPVSHPLDDLVARYARTHVPFVIGDVVARLDVTAERALATLTRLESAGRIVHGEFRPGGVEREWCDSGVLRALRRRSLAALRHEVEPVDASTFVRFLAAWHGIGRGRRGTDALVGAIEQLQGVAIPVSVLERDVLPARVDGYRTAMLDELCAAGDLVWTGAGALGAEDGKVRLFFRDGAKQLASSVLPAEQPTGPLHDAIRQQLARAGASFWPDLVAAAPEDGEAVLLSALWDLVWAGEVTNDTFGPLRASRRTSVRRTNRARPHPGRLTRLGPPAGAGRWSLVATILDPAPSPTEMTHAMALQLLERHGVVTREAVRAEGTPGGFAAVYPVLRALEEAGRARRGWFVAGLGAAQFALPGAVDRLRAHRHVPDDEPGRVVVFAATDPAQPYGAALSWPEHSGASRPTRAAGAHVVHIDGGCVAYLERGGRTLLTFNAASSVEDPNVWVNAIVEAHKEGRLGRLQIERIDDEPARTSRYAPLLRSAGFADGYKGLTLHK